MLFIAGTFPVAIYFSTIATERTIAAVAADEAFAKVRLYAIGSPNDLSDDNQWLKKNEGEIQTIRFYTDGDDGCHRGCSAAGQSGIAGCPHAF
ncbi:unnamed protein product [marine sediment metagenome]|uniref:Uncharacterized protein n=1 Tax=marine sediment metagenome TaxID=412755 RepID=X1FY84_9ZZZZ